VFNALQGFLDTPHGFGITNCFVTALTSPGDLATVGEGSFSGFWGILWRDGVMAKSRSEFTYVTYIASPPRKVWGALFEPTMIKKYWHVNNVSDWKPGSRWEHRCLGKRGEVMIAGKVVECSPPRRLVMTWASPEEEACKEKVSRVALDLKPFHGITRLTVTHDRLEPGSDMLEGIMDGWPRVLSGLKTLLETGRSAPAMWC